MHTAFKCVYICITLPKILAYDCVLTEHMKSTVYTQRFYLMKGFNVMSVVEIKETQCKS